jgi:predicted small integral membrane protein
MIRMSKIVLVVFVGLQGLFYGLNNIVNFKQAVSFVTGVLPMEGHAAYPNAFGPAITWSPLIVATLCVIIMGELLIAGLSFKGAYDMVRARNGPSGMFNTAKTYAVLGCAMALIVWFGLFLAVGGAYFQMWQTDLGAAAMTGAFQYSVTSGLVLLFVNTPDTPPEA